MNERAALERAMMAFIEGEAEPEELARLEEALRAAPALTRELSAQLAMDSLLRQHEALEEESFTEAVRFRLAANPEEDRRFVDNVRRALAEEGGAGFQPASLFHGRPAPRAGGTPAPPSFARQAGKPAFLSRRLAALAAAAALVAGLWFWWAPLSAPPPSPMVEPDWLARSVLHSGTEFAPGLAPDHDTLRAGKYHLLRGEVLLQFINDVQVTLRGPARWELESALRMTVEEGTVRVSVPENARGFTIRSGGVDFRDLGTEFGLQAEAATGRRVMQVFSGEVDVLRSDDQEVLASLTDGQAFVVTAAHAGPAPKMPLSAFPDPQSLALSCWEAQARARAADPALLVYFPMWPDTERSKTLANAATASTTLMPEAVISGCEWVTGRWPGKPALQFEHPGDAVRFHLPGEYTDLTASFWLKIDRTIHPWTHVWGSSRFTPRSVHLCLHGTRSLDGDAGHFSAQGIMGERRKTTSVGFPHRRGAWMHVSLVLDSATQETRLYLNGQRSSCYTWTRDDWLFALGDMTIGRFDDPADPDGREFRGRLDEFALWSRVLSDQEILALSREGQPPVP